jgi:hypothetical protein
MSSIATTVLVPAIETLAQHEQTDYDYDDDDEDKTAS